MVVQQYLGVTATNLINRNESAADAFKGSEQHRNDASEGPSPRPRHPDFRRGGREPRPRAVDRRRRHARTRRSLRHRDHHGTDTRGVGADRLDDPHHGATDDDNGSPDNDHHGGAHDNDDNPRPFRWAP